MGVDGGPLGRDVGTPSAYAPDLLHAIPRSGPREALGLGRELPFVGQDLWTAYELSWLDQRGRPQVAIGRFSVPATSPNLIESKSLKLYLSSLNAERYADHAEVEALIAQDLSRSAGQEVAVALGPPRRELLAELPGIALDELQISVDRYQPDPELLFAGGEVVEERFRSDLFRSLCPVTGQPDWASIAIHYRGPSIEPESLLRYLVSFREHRGFHEDCVERIFLDLRMRCETEALTVQACFTRRGGLDISPFRSDHEREPEPVRVARQ